MIGPGFAANLPLSKWLIGFVVAGVAAIVGWLVFGLLWLLKVVA